MLGCGRLIVLIGSLLVSPAAAQGLFDPIVRVNESVVTRFEVDQRARLLQILNAPGATRAGAIDALIDDRLQLQAARTVGLSVGGEGLAAGLAEFAARASLTTDELLEALAASGVERETLEDFVAVQILWRDLIRARYGARVDVSEADIDKAIGSAGRDAAIDVLLSEVVMPAPPPQAAAVRARAEEISQSRSVAEFASYARRFSRSESAPRGGRMPWTSLSDLPPGLRAIVLNLTKGEVTAPLPIPNGIVLFQLRDIRERTRGTPRYAAIEYAIVKTADGAATLRQRVDTCDDLYGAFLGAPEGTLDRRSAAPGDIDGDVELALVGLDDGELADLPTRAGEVVMLCGRVPALAEDGVDRAAVAAELRQARFQGFADALLNELRADATITRLGQ